MKQILRRVGWLVLGAVVSVAALPGQLRVTLSHDGDEAMRLLFGRGAASKMSMWTGSITNSTPGPDSVLVDEGLILRWKGELQLYPSYKSHLLVEESLRAGWRRRLYESLVFGSEWGGLAGLTDLVKLKDWEIGALLFIGRYGPTLGEFVMGRGPRVEQNIERLRREGSWVMAPNETLTVTIWSAKYGKPEGTYSFIIPRGEMRRVLNTPE